MDSNVGFRGINECPGLELITLDGMVIERELMNAIINCIGIRFYEAKPDDGRGRWTFRIQVLPGGMSDSVKTRDLDRSQLASVIGEDSIPPASGPLSGERA